MMGKSKLKSRALIEAIGGASSFKEKSNKSKAKYYLVLIS